MSHRAKHSRFRHRMLNLIHHRRRNEPNAKYPLKRPAEKKNIFRISDFRVVRNVSKSRVLQQFFKLYVYKSYFVAVKLFI